MSVLLPPRVQLAWSATALGSSFGAYRVYRRPARGPVSAWQQIGELDVPTGYTPATVEAQHIAFTDYEAGWGIAGGQWADGWDYAVSVYNKATGLESALSTIDSRNVVTPDAGWWLTSNAAPYLNFPLASVMETTGADRSVVRRYSAAGRDTALTRTPLELPERVVNLQWTLFDRLGEDMLRPWRAAAATGRALALLGPRGDRWIGALESISDVKHASYGILEVGAELVETSRSSILAGYNLPAGLVLDGAADRITHPDTGDLLDPGSSAFSVVMLADYSGIAANAYALAKIAAGDGYGLRRDGSNQLQFFVDGATTSGGPVEAIANWTGRRVAVGTSSGTAQVLYRDGVAVANTSVTHGAVANGELLSIGARSDAANWAAAPVHAWAVYLRELTPTEALNASRYLLGYPGYRPPAGAAVFVDLRDTRTWSGAAAVTTANDLSGNALHGTIVSAPPVRGVPWPLSVTDRF